MLTIVCSLMIGMVKLSLLILVESSHWFSFGVRAQTGTKIRCGKDMYMLKVVSSEKIQVLEVFDHDS